MNSYSGGKLVSTDKAQREGGQKTHPPVSGRLCFVSALMPQNERRRPFRRHSDTRRTPDLSAQIMKHARHVYRLHASTPKPGKGNVQVGQALATWRRS